jgi:5-methylthioadenosine/S-adenosylhomocysteine deaminase
MDAGTVFAMATAGGAAALGLQDAVGRLAPGMLADITCLRLAGLHTAPVPDLVDRPDAAALASLVVYACRAGDVDTVLVGGEVVVRGGRLLTADQAELVQEAGLQRRALMDRMAARG